MHPVAGRPMLERVVETVARAGLDDLVVVLGAKAERSPRRPTSATPGS